MRGDTHRIRGSHKVGLPTALKSSGPLLFKTRQLLPLRHGSRNPDAGIANDTSKKSERLKEGSKKTSENTDGLQELSGSQDEM